MFTHHLFEKDDVCFKHDDKSKKKVYKDCHLNLQACKVVLCWPYFKKRNQVSMNVDLKKYRTCELNNVRRNSDRGNQCLV